MKINQRQSEMYQYIKKNESVKVQDLLLMFQVSAPTIRKDLAILEDAGMIVRTHGAARMASQADPITPFEARSSLHKEAKEMIARKAVQYIEEGDSIILDSGTTTLEIARLLTGWSNLNIFTNSIPIAMMLSSSRVSVNLVGGILLGRNFSLQGPDTEEYFHRIEVSKTFISASGIRLNYGLVNSQSLESSVKKSMISAGKTVFAVLDSSKFQTPSVYPSGKWAELDYIITETPIKDNNIREQIENSGIKVLMAE